jgi:energy-converting hydrogenase Eha subunit E
MRSLLRHFEVVRNPDHDDPILKRFRLAIANEGVVLVFVGGDMITSSA